MPKFFTKKQIFAFLASFFITFVVGIFGWFLIYNSEFIFNKINYALFKASVYSNVEIKEIFPAASTESFEQSEDSKLDDPIILEKNFENYTGVGGPNPVLMSEQEMLDDIAEKIDIIQAQVNELTKESQNSEKTEEIEENKEKEEEVKEDENKHDQEVEKTAIVYLKVLIYETKISPIEQRFIKLYNPNDTAIDLTGWYLQRKTATGLDYTSCVSKNDFLGKTILPKGYFLISRENSSADIFMPDLVLTENNYLALKNPRGEISDTAKTAQENFIVASGSGGGALSPVYSKILISEVQIAGLTEEKEEFVELFNPNNEELDLSGWYLHRKTETGSDYSTFVSNNLFSAKKIGALGYFLIAREESSFAGSADIITDSSLGNNASSSTLALKNPNGEISDKLGFGLAQDFETAPATGPEKGQSIGRKFLEGTEQDTNDNSLDFEAQSSTPKALNTAYVAPEEPPPILIDTTAPEVVFTLGALQTSLTFTINFEITDILGTVTPSGLASYIFQWKKEGEDWHPEDEVEIESAPLTATGTWDFKGLDETTYYFWIKAKDIAKNESVLPETPVSTKISIPKKVLITDVQIEGDSTKHDFIKFYNPNESNIFLKNYRLVKRAETSSGDITIKSWSREPDAKIMPKSYYLWASSDDENYFLLQYADTFTGNGISKNNGIALRYGQEDTGEIIDALGWGDFSNVLYEINPYSENPEENQQLFRLKIGEDYQDTYDNSLDFSLCQITTPGDQELFCRF